VCCVLRHGDDDRTIFKILLQLVFEKLIVAPHLP